MEKIKLKLQKVLIFQVTFQLTISILIGQVYFYSFHLVQLFLPRPGPTFDIELAAPEIDVIKSRPLMDKSIAIIKKINKKVKIKIITELIKSSEIF